MQPRIPDPAQSAVELPEGGSGVAAPDRAKPLAAAKDGFAGPKKVENTEYAGFVRRSLRAYGRRVGAGDLEDLRDLVALRDELDGMISRTVRAVHAGDPDAGTPQPWTMPKRPLRQRLSTPA